MLHQEIKTQLKAQSGTANRDQSTDSYTGSCHFFYAVPVPMRRQIIKDLIRNHPDITDQQWRTLANDLFAGRVHEEKTMGAMILQYRPTVRTQVSFRLLRAWLEQLVGWAEVDALAYNIFTADELLARWSSWERFLSACAHSKNIQVRRAALVLLCGPISRSADMRLHALAYALVLQLATEKSILITKAISWLLRCQIDTQKISVAVFMAKHDLVLPRLVVREVTRKLATGKKNR